MDKTTTRKPRNLPPVLEITQIQTGGLLRAGGGARGGASPREGALPTSMPTWSPEQLAVGLAGKEISAAIFQSGRVLYEKGHVKATDYKWIFHVSGATHKKGSAVYTVDLRYLTCGCEGWINARAGVCKHMVAAIHKAVEPINLNLIAVL